ncbi:MAG: competence/damage-inducible protein A [Candidatus Aminicenantes bacterium]|nr:competence/damage-inducible protein A [Candidatus Aminicenantes bacterium]
MKRVEILAVGSELLTPFFQDTNSLFLTERLNSLGLDVSFKMIVGDEEEDLVLGLEDAVRLSDLILVMGGLGPTADDRTREAAARVFGRKLIPCPEVMERIQDRFRRRGLSMPDCNRKQSLILEGAEVLRNDFGTAPGQWIDRNGKIIVLLPGPPHELKPMFDAHVLPRFECFRLGHFFRKTLKLTGITESAVEDLMTGLTPDDPSLGISILAQPGQIEIHLKSLSPSSPEEAEARLKPFENALLSRIGENVFSVDGKSLEEVVGSLLCSLNATLACAESCTGGLISHRLTNVPGISRGYLGGMIAYSNRAKTDWLGVGRDVLIASGSVSAQAAEAMAAGVRRESGADFGLAVTGIAGPGGGTPEKPVGLVYTALAEENGVESSRNLFLGDRDQIKFQSSQKALDMLRRRLLVRRP